ncbi:MAG TPA: site-specific integrase [Rhodocyclaceae bacterium]|nr:site-specific integrase [Rhodocyclaceae bacterium]
MATIRKRKSSKKYEVQIRRDGWPTLTRTFTKAADASAWASVIESEMERGVFIDRTEAEKNTLGDLLRRYLNEVSSQKKGRDSERYRLISLQHDPIAKIKAAGLSGKLMAEWRDQRLKKVSGSTTNRDLNLISHVINVARKEWGIHIENPISMIRRPPENRARNRRLGAGEEEKLLAELEMSTRSNQGTFEGGGSRNPWIRPLVVLALETAMRRSELLALRWQDVFLPDCYVRLHDSKNGDSRDVPLSSRAHSVLEGLPRHISGRVFPITSDAVKKAFTRAVARAGLGDFHFHDLRHEATSRIAEKLDNVLELSAVTGHKTLTMLKRYYHPRAKDLARKLG